MKKSYVILSENNEWLATGFDETQEEINDTIEGVRETLRINGKDENAQLYFVEMVGRPELIKK